MKRAAIAFGLVLGLAGAAYGQAGVILLWSDPDHTICDTPASGFQTWYLTYEFHDGARSVDFAIDTHANFVLIADWWNFTLVTRTSDVGVIIEFGACLPAPIDLGRTFYYGLGTAPVCSKVDVVPDPGAASGRIEMVDCEQNVRFPMGAGMTVESNGTCGCIPIPVEKTSWGRVKALYVD